MAGLSLTLTLDPASYDVHRLLGEDNANRAIDAGMSAIGAQLTRRSQAIAQSEARGPTGEMAQSYGYRLTPGHQGLEFFNKLKAAVFLEFGTGIFGPIGKRIVPTRAMALAWTPYNVTMAGGLNPQGRRVKRTTVTRSTSMMFRRSVAGIVPRRIVSRAWDAMTDADNAAIADQISLVLSGLASLS